jgi:fructan beta-fructosidase
MISNLIKQFCAILVMSVFLYSCNQSKQPVTGKSTEKHRPKIHFSPEANWMNDPNGMVYYDGEYHLFYQYYPDSTVWGPMHWGHAISKDLIHWEQLPTALFPDSMGMIFSGSAVVDKGNTSGLGKDGIPPMVAIFTYHNMNAEKTGKTDFQTQGLAYSLDKGRTWTKYENNPIIKNPGIRDFRDPKVFWNQQAGIWNMILAVADHVNIYSSTNLLEWNLESEFGFGVGSHNGVWECPDLFPCQIEGTTETKWVMLVSVGSGAPNGGSGTQYFVGDFDGHTFEYSGIKTKWIDYGKDNYAGVTWADIPEKDGRRIFIGWMNNWQYANQIPTSIWRGACTIPRTLKLIEIYDDYLLRSNPVEEFNKLKGKEKKLAATTISGELEVQESADFPIEVNLTFSTENSTQLTFAEKFGIILSNSKNEKLKIGYDNLNKLFFIDRTNAGWDNPSKDFAQIHYAPYINNDPSLEIRLIFDKSSIELFAKNGLVVMTEQFFPTEEFSVVSLFAEKGDVKFTGGSITKLKCIW